MYTSGSRLFGDDMAELCQESERKMQRSVTSPCMTNTNTAEICPLIVYQTGTQLYSCIAFTAFDFRTSSINVVVFVFCSDHFRNYERMHACVGLASSL